MSALDRRQFLHLAGVGGAVFMSGLSGTSCAVGGTAASTEDFYFVQLSDTHWGFEGPPNPDARGTLPKAVAAERRPLAERQEGRIAAEGLDLLKPRGATRERALEPAETGRALDQRRLAALISCGGKTQEPCVRRILARHNSLPLE